MCRLRAPATSKYDTTFLSPFCQKRSLPPNLDSLKKLEHEVAVVGIAQRLRGLYDAVQVRVQQLHHDVQLVVVLADEQVLQRHDVRVRTQVPRSGCIASGGKVCMEAEGRVVAVFDLKGS